MTATPEQDQPVSAILVTNEKRLDFLPECFGIRLMMPAESAVYSWMRELNNAYTGAYWNFYKLSNGGFYLAPELKGPLTFDVVSNGNKCDVSADAAGIITTLYALNQLAFDYAGYKEGDAMADAYHLLRDFAGMHAEANSIYRAID